MKAGIYQTPNKNLIYVAKDRTIKATTLMGSNWIGTKVSEKKGQVVIANTNYRCDRVGDVPNGCTDFMQLLADKLEELNITSFGHEAKPRWSSSIEHAEVYDGKRSISIAIADYDALATQAGNAMHQFIEKMMGKGFTLVHDELIAPKGMTNEEMRTLMDEALPKLHQGGRTNVNSALFAPYGEKTNTELKPEDFYTQVKHDVLCDILRLHGFEYNSDVHMFEASENDYQRFKRARMEGKLPELDSQAFTISVKTLPPKPETEAQRHAREELHFRRLGKTLSMIRNTCSGAPVSTPPLSAIDAAYSESDTALAALKAGKFRLCHAASARKHKKKKDRHVWFHPVFGCYAWRMIA